MSIDWESILPNRAGEERTERYRFAYNMAIEDCLESLKAAEARGEICKPLSVSDIQPIITEWLMLHYGNTALSVNNINKLAEAIHRAMTNKGDVCDR